MPPSCTTSAQNPGGSVRPPLFASHDGSPAFAAGFGAAAALSTQRDRRGRTDASDHKREKYPFHGRKLYRLLNEGAMNARQHPRRALAATFADEIEIAAGSKRQAFALRLVER